VSEQNPDREAIGAAQDLTTALTAMAGEVRRLRRFGRTNRWFILFDVLLTIALAASGAVAVHASDVAGQNRNAALISCQATNVAREQNEELWAYVLRLFVPRPGETAKEKARGEKVLAALRAEVDATFAPRNCAHVVEGERS
jgi:hypothetical protein